jgi:hypothetical protein
MGAAAGYSRTVIHQVRYCFDPNSLHRIIPDHIVFISKYKGTIAIGHRYLLAFAETHRSVVSLPSTITILWHVCQNTPHCLKRNVLHLNDKCKNFLF